MKGKVLASKPAERGRPRWGYCRVKVETICWLWTAYREGTLERQDIQTWFGVQELLMRRCTLPSSRQPSYSVNELAPLTGLRATGVRASLRRLQRAGFVAWSEHRIDVKDGPDDTLLGLRAMLVLVPNNRRTLPIPRHTVLLLARSRRPVLLATLLGHLLRCMYYRSGECVSWGTCKASYIAKVFGVDVRNVKAARRELEQVGWLRQLESLHWHRQRFGGSFVVSLDWSNTTSRCGRISPPRSVPSTPKLPPPESHRTLPSELKYQNRVADGRTGVSRIKNGNERIPPPQAPTWRHVERHDLSDSARLLTLYEQARLGGAVSSSEMDRLRFFTAAEHALAKGTRNPCGLFVHLVKHKLWKFCTERDEDLARQRLKRTLYGVLPPTPATPPPVQVAKRMSDDARLAQAIHAVSIREGIPSLVLIRRMRPDWTLERYELALQDARTSRKLTLPAKAPCIQQHFHPATSMEEECLPA